MHVEAHDPIEQLQSLRRLKRHRAIATRLQIVILARQGHTAPQIAQATGVSRRPVQAWVQRYNTEGVAGLWDRPRSGQPPKLSPDQEEAFKQRLRQGPLADADQGVCTLRGKDVQRILAEQFNAHYSLSGTIDLLHRLGFSCLKPRPRHRKNDPRAMQRWVEDAPLLSSK